MHTMDPWLIVIIMLIFSAFFSGMEIAFISSNKLKVEVDKSKGSLSARILSDFINKPSRFIGALLLGNNVALVIYGTAMAILLEPFSYEVLPESMQHEYLILLFQTLISTFIILLVAEFVPKALFRIKPNVVLDLFAVPLLLFYYLFYPIIYILIGFSEWVLFRLFRLKSPNEKYVFSPIDLDEYIKEFSSGDQKEEGSQEIQIFQNAINFKNVKLRECMVPRPEIEAVEVNEPIHEIRERFSSTGHSKILVFKDSIDNVIGYTHSFDMFRNPENIKDILKSIIIVPETIAANEVLKMMIQQHKSAAVVVDEFGGTSGMVTMEDIIEEIFGEIEDEYDVEEMIEKQVSHKEYIFSARLEIDYLNEKYNLDLPKREEFETLAGLIINYDESIPVEGDEILIDNFRFTILQATENRIEQVRLNIEI